MTPGVVVRGGVHKVWCEEVRGVWCTGCGARLLKKTYIYIIKKPKS